MFHNARQDAHTSGTFNKALYFMAANRAVSLEKKIAAHNETGIINNSDRVTTMRTKDVIEYFFPEFYRNFLPYFGSCRRKLRGLEYGHGDTFLKYNTLPHPRNGALRNEVG
jgi:hypothetical protein